MNQILNIKGLPVKARLEWSGTWETTMSEQGIESIFSFVRSSTGKPAEIPDWTVPQRQVREDFMRITTPDEALEFFTKYGAWRRMHPLPPKKQISESTPDVAFSTLMKYKEMWKEFIAQQAPECFGPEHLEGSDLNSKRLFHTLHLGLHPSPQFTVEMGHIRARGAKVPAPFLQQYAVDVESAIYNSIFIDKMAGLRGGICAREGCGSAFLSDSDRPKMFCTTKCGDAARQLKRRRAERGKKTATAPTKKTTRQPAKEK